MPFTLIKGTYHVVGYQPDGDSIRFKADHPSHWDRLEGPAVERNAKDHVQLRIEAIDTLETHYKGFHQPLDLATQAMDFLLDGLGIKNVQFGPSGISVVSAQDGTRGYILARHTEANRRPVSFVYAGNSPEADGASVVLRSPRLKSSLNYKSVAAGLAYPTYYEGLFYDLRETLTEAAEAARKNNWGLWPRDRTNKGFKVPNVSAVTDTHVILPKLFRRIVSFIGAGGSIAGFKQYLEAYPDPVLDLSNGHFTNLDSFVQVTNKRVRLTVAPERLVFQETA